MLQSRGDTRNIIFSVTGIPGASPSACGRHCSRIQLCIGKEVLRWSSLAYTYSSPREPGERLLLTAATTRTTAPLFAKLQHTPVASQPYKHASTTDLLIVEHTRQRLSHLNSTSSTSVILRKQQRRLLLASPESFADRDMYLDLSRRKYVSLSLLQIIVSRGLAVPGEENR